jgi:hypothetical protein
MVDKLKKKHKKTRIRVIYFYFNTIIPLYLYQLLWIYLNLWIPVDIIHKILKNWYTMNNVESTVSFN